MLSYGLQYYGKVCAAALPAQTGHRSYRILEGLRGNLKRPQCKAHRGHTICLCHDDRKIGITLEAPTNDRVQTLAYSHLNSSDSHRAVGMARLARDRVHAKDTLPRTEFSLRYAGLKPLACCIHAANSGVMSSSD